MTIRLHVVAPLVAVLLVAALALPLTTRAGDHFPNRELIVFLTFGVGLLPTYTNEGNALVPFVIAAMALLLFAWFHPGVRLRRQRSERARDRQQDDREHSWLPAEGRPDDVRRE